MAANNMTGKRTIIILALLFVLICFGYLKLDNKIKQNDVLMNKLMFSEKIYYFKILIPKNIENKVENKIIFIDVIKNKKILKSQRLCPAKDIMGKDNILVVKGLSLTKLKLDILNGDDISHIGGVTTTIDFSSFRQNNNGVLATRLENGNELKFQQFFYKIGHNKVLNNFKRLEKDEIGLMLSIRSGSDPNSANLRDKKRGEL